MFLYIPIPIPVQNVHILVVVPKTLIMSILDVVPGKLCMYCTKLASNIPKLFMRTENKECLTLG